MKKLLILLLATLFILSTVAGGIACSSGDTESETYTSSDISADGGALELTASDGTTCSLIIQSGALTEITNIKITAESSSSGSSLGALSNDFLLEPEGLEFDLPVTVAITVPNPLPSDRVSVILHTIANAHGVILETQVDGQTLTASLTHFSSITIVAPTAAQLELYWDSVMLEIDTYGLSIERIRSLASIYVYAETNRNIYNSIDISLWKQELWSYTNDLIIMGSLECSTGNYQEAEYILEAARNIAILCYFADLEAQVDQDLQGCQQMSGSSFPEIQFRISDPTGGVGEIFINDWCLARADQSAWYQDTGWKTLYETDPQGNPWAGQNGLVLTVKFLVRPRTGSRSDIPSAYFELKVNGQVIFSERLSANKGETFETSTTLPFPNVTPP